MSQNQPNQQAQRPSPNVAPAPQQQTDEASRNAEKQFREGIKHAKDETMKPPGTGAKPAGSKPP